MFSFFLPPVSSNRSVGHVGQDPRSIIPPIPFPHSSSLFMPPVAFFAAKVTCLTPETLRSVMEMPTSLVQILHPCIPSLPP